MVGATATMIPQVVGRAFVVAVALAGAAAVGAWCHLTRSGTLRRHQNLRQRPLRRRRWRVDSSAAPGVSTGQIAGVALAPVCAGGRPPCLQHFNY